MRILLIAALFWLMSSPSMAAGHCGPWEAYVETLAKAYREMPLAQGIAFNGKVLTIFAAEDGSWSITVTYTNGITCMIASGQNWETIPQAELPIEGKDISI